MDSATFILAVFAALGLLLIISTAEAEYRAWQDRRAKRRRIGL